MDRQQLEMLQEERSASSERNHQKQGKLYPDLSELEESEEGDPESAKSDEELQALIKKLEKAKLRKRERKKEKGGSKAPTPRPMTV